MNAGQINSYSSPSILFLDGQNTALLPLIKRKERLHRLFRKEIAGLRYSEHVLTDGSRFREHACRLGLEGVISKRIDRPYAPGDRGLWVKSKCLNREEFVVVGWTDPERSRQHIGALLLGYYTDDGRLHYAGRAGTGMNDRELERLAGVLAPLQVPKMPLAAPPPRDNRFGSPLKLSKVHWVRPDVVMEVTYLTWTESGHLSRRLAMPVLQGGKPALRNPSAYLFVGSGCMFETAAMRSTPMPGQSASSPSARDLASSTSPISASVAQRRRRIAGSRGLSATADLKQEAASVSRPATK